MRKLSNDPETKQAYDKIFEQQLEEGIIELVPKTLMEVEYFICRINRWLESMQQLHV